MGKSLDFPGPGDTQNLGALLLSQCEYSRGVQPTLISPDGETLPPPPPLAGSCSLCAQRPGAGAWSLGELSNLKPQPTSLGQQGAANGGSSESRRSPQPWLCGSDSPQWTAGRHGPPSGRSGKGRDHLRGQDSDLPCSKLSTEAPAHACMNTYTQARTHTRHIKTHACTHTYENCLSLFELL